MNCGTCRSDPKYKCPTCMVPYCSVACYKLHKQNPCIKPPSPPKQTIGVKQAVENLYPTEDTVPLDRLNLLENSTEVKKCLENPHVREILELLDSSANPDELVQEYMQEPIFTEFVDACLKVVQPQ
ncbi:zinc finger HIT domain-containing protein 3 [Bombyx mandarina]|uniref:Zinc finger HIT domain-containing protein 3 n=1 Tax=Bombyx mandarina TaxID=7092 RepID=A0A6J2KI96_BOMMA|nr:zinc finger HIT domain-containing protein 3 [Bombyx mandarina]